MFTLTRARLLDLTILGLTLGALALLGVVDGYLQFVFGLVAIWTILCTGLNVLFGLTGLVSIGQIGFFAIGAYATGILVQNGLSFWLSLPLACVIAAAIGVVLAWPAVRMAGPFIAMVTIAFAFIVEHVAIEWRSLTGGQNGLMGFQMPSIVDSPMNELSVTILSILIAGVGLLAYRRFADSRWGVAMVALRDEDVAASATGFDAFNCKLAAFVIAAGAAGLAGGLFAALMQFIAPSNFHLSQSILFLFAVILGGSGAVLGPLAGAAVVVLLPEMLSGLAEYRLMFFGALLIFVLRLAPRGIVGTIAQFIPPFWQELPISKSDDSAVEFQGPKAQSSLSVHDLSINFGGVKAVDGVSFEALPGEVTAVIGPNGAGKTTLLNMVSGFYTPDKGRIETLGQNIVGWHLHQTAALGLARTFQATRLFGSLSVEQNVMSGLSRGRLGGVFTPLSSPDQRHIAQELLELVGYRGDPRLPASDLAHVDKRLVEIARALALCPHALLLDEPAAGLMQADKRALSALLRKLAETGIAVVLVEHDMELVMGLSDRVLVMDAGRPIAFADPVTVRSDPAVIAAYLGEGDLTARPRTREREPGEVLTLATKHLNAGYGSVDVLKDVNIHVSSGELVTLLGANGAGKSTLLRTMTGLMAPTSGEILFEDHNISALPAHRVVEYGLILVPEGRQVFPELTVTQNIELGGYRHATLPEPGELDAILDRFPRLKDRINQPAGLLSGGEQQMMAIARGLMAKPKLLLLDEPSLGLAPAMIEELYTILAELRDDGITTLLVDQMAGLALDVADRGYVLEQGHVVAQGTATQLKSNDTLISAYLGGEADTKVAG